MKLQNYYDEATDFIKSCSDENNDDDLSFDERVKSKIDTIDDEIVKSIVINSLKFAERKRSEAMEIRNARIKRIKKWINKNYKFLDFYNELENEINNLKSENSDLKERVEWLECELVNHIS